MIANSIIVSRKGKYNVKKQKTRMSQCRVRDEWLSETWMRERLPEQYSPLYWGNWFPLQSLCDSWGCSPECQPMWVQGSSRSVCLQKRKSERKRVWVSENSEMRILVVGISLNVMIIEGVTCSFIIDSRRYKSPLNPFRRSDIIVQLNDLISSERNILRNNYRYGIKSDHLHWEMNKIIHNRIIHASEGIVRGQSRKQWNYRTNTFWNKIISFWDNCILK